MTNRLSNAASEIYNAVVGTLSGLQSNVQGLLLIATSPALGWKCFRHTPEALVGVAVSYGFVWLFCWPMQWLGLLEVSWNEILRIASIPALLILRVVLPIASEEVFFAVIKSRDECLESSLHGLPRLRGLKDTLIFWAKLAAGGISAIGLITASAPLIMPPLIAAVTSAGVAIFALGPLVIAVGCATVVVLAVLVGAGAMVFDKFLQPLVSIWRFDPILCVVVLICVMFGGFKLSAIGQVLRTAMEVYLSASIMTRELLMQYAQRLESEEWKAFRRHHCWRILGFGLPIWGLTRLHPAVVVLLLQVFHGAAGSLLTDLLNLPPPPPLKKAKA